MSHGTAKLHDGVHERSCQVNSQKPWKSVKYRLHARFMRAHTPKQREIPELLSKFSLQKCHGNLVKLGNFGNAPRAAARDDRLNRGAHAVERARRRGCASSQVPCRR